MNTNTNTYTIRKTSHVMWPRTRINKTLYNNTANNNNLSNNINSNATKETH